MTARPTPANRSSNSSMSIPRQPLPSLEDLISSVSATSSHIISPSTSVHRQQTAASSSHPPTFPRIIRANNASDSPPAQSPSASRDVACTPPLSNSPTRTRRPSAGPLSLRPPTLHRPGSHTHTTLSSPHLALHQSPPPFPRPPYLDHSFLRHLLQTELPPNLPPSRYTQSTIYPFVPRHTSITPALIDDSDAESTTASPPPGLPPSPPTSTSAKSPSETSTLVSSSPVFRLPTRWSEQDRHTYLSVSADGRELTYHG
jgi:hypothetical protein